jgi:thiol-disulfide isomerase/thioredoxin
MMRSRLLLLMLTLGLFGSAPIPTRAQDTPAQPVYLYFFWGQGCPYCHMEQLFLEELVARYPQVIIRDYEVYHSEVNRIYWSRMLAVHGREPGGVPTTFIGDRYWVGFSDNVARQIEAQVALCLQNPCANPGSGIVPQPDDDLMLRPQPAIADAAPAETLITLPLIGAIDLAGQSLWFSTGLIAFVDGFNPCSLWVLSILLALVIHSGSRRKTFIVGFTFLTVTTLVYGLFIVGLFTIFSFVGFIGWIRAAVALLALAFALINIKDYFWYKAGISLTIADRHKPGIYRDMRGLMAGDKSPLALMAATAVMALGITLVELPCTSGFPVLWTNILAAHEVPALTFALLLGLYMLIYLADELIVFGSVVLTLKASRFEEKQGRLLRLVGGMVMLSLALVLLVDPAIMNNIGSSLLVFGGALAVTGLILLLHRRILPALGVHIGTESAPRPGRKHFSKSHQRD